MSMVQMAAVRTDHRVLRRLTGVFNPVVLRFAPHIPFYVVLEHRGRRSGRVFRTPLAGIRVDRGFLLPLAFGEKAQWVLNVRHAFGGVVEWRGRRIVVSDPEVITWNEGKSSVPPLQQRLAPVFGVKRFLRVHDATKRS
jgi:deazaflavin-dependent oxidoreductase (nitroreductase family)